MSESLIQGLHEECRAAQAQAAAWEEIALLLVDSRPMHQLRMLKLHDRNKGKFCCGTCRPEVFGFGDSPRAALLAWHAEQRKDGVK